VKRLNEERAIRDAIHPTFIRQSATIAHHLFLDLPSQKDYYLLGDVCFHPALASNPSSFQRNTCGG
jgi:hypothetical protein